jgi:UDP-glucose 4-epimerase
MEMNSVVGSAAGSLVKQRNRLSTWGGKMTTALITGGAGFIGSHLAEALLALGWKVEVMDDLSTGAIDNIAHLKGHPRFSYVLDSVMNRSAMIELVDRADMVFHLAAAVGVRLIVEQPVRTIETNIKATELILELCARKGKPVLLISTSEVYGKSEREKFSEEDDLILGATSKARWCYAASKIIDEFLAKAYFKEKKLPTVVVRVFNTIGPRQTGQYGMVVPRFVRQALSGKPITVYGDGTQQRSFTWVGDVVDALITLIQHGRAFGEVFNIGHTKEISISQLAVMVKEMTRSQSDIVFVPYDQAYEAGFEDMNRRLPDISKIQQLIGYQPSLDLPDMLKRIIAHERERLTGTTLGPSQLTRPVEVDQDKVMLFNSARSSS